MADKYLKFGFRAKSTKTRIETKADSSDWSTIEKVLEQNPPKQGLKPIHSGIRYVW